MNTRLLRWIPRVLSLLVLAFGLPFYFGYGNPLPFLDPVYTAWDNTWLTAFPLMFLGLVAAWFFEFIGGLAVMVVLVVSTILGLIFEGEIVPFMLLPLVPGILFTISGYLEKRNHRAGTPKNKA